MKAVLDDVLKRVKLPAEGEAVMTRNEAEVFILVKQMRDAPNDEDVQSHGCYALAGLAVDDSCRLVTVVNLR